MQYDFDLMTNRYDSNAMKWDVAEEVLPMWVADMDFKTAPEVQQAIMKKVEQGIFGYTIVPEAWYHAYGEWWKKRHSFALDSEWLMFCTGVVPAISSIVRKMTTVGEKILVQTPAYNIFFNSITNNGRVIQENRLKYDGDIYQIDFDDLERQLSDAQTSMMILCNPHNPVGRVWKKEELAKIGELCHQYGVLVLSDEIHCDLVFDDAKYVPFASVSSVCRDNSITCIAPTKAFNLAGIQTSAISVPNPQLRHKVNRGINTDEVAEPNALAIEAAIAALTQGEPWLLALQDYLWENRLVAEQFIKEHITELLPVGAKATYLMWIDCHQIVDDTEAFCEHLKEATGLYILAGGAYGSSGVSFIRLNLACPRERLMDGLHRLAAGVKTYK